MNSLGLNGPKIHAIYSVELQRLMTWWHDDMMQCKHAKMNATYKTNHPTKLGRHRKKASGVPVSGCHKNSENQLYDLASVIIMTRYHQSLYLGNYDNRNSTVLHPQVGWTSDEYFKSNMFVKPVHWKPTQLDYFSQYFPTRSQCQ